MKKLMMSVAIATGLLGAGFFFSAVSADPTSECTSGTVYTSPGGGTGVCIDTDPVADAPIEGGSVEVSTCYAIVDGDNENNVVGGPDDPFSGYAGVSCGIEPADDGSNGACDDNDGPDTNTGGCYGIKNVATVDTETIPVVGPAADDAPQPVCGDDTGGYRNSRRDGCRIP